MQNGGQQKNKKCDVGNYGWEGKTWKTQANMDWIDNIKKWCNKDLYSLTISARDRKLWKQTMKFALNTYAYTGCQSMDPDDDDQCVFNYILTLNRITV